MADWVCSPEQLSSEFWQKQKNSNIVSSFDSNAFQLSLKDDGPELSIPLFDTLQLHCIPHVGVYGEVSLLLSFTFRKTLVGLFFCCFCFIFDSCCLVSSSFLLSSVPFLLLFFDIEFRIIGRVFLKYLFNFLRLKKKL